MYIQVFLSNYRSLFIYLDDSLQGKFWPHHRGLRRSEIMFLFLFVILLISCWGFAASHMAEKTNVGMAVVIAASRMPEKTNVGMAVVIADITSMCGFGSDGAAALLSACSFVLCCRHQHKLLYIEMTSALTTIYTIQW